MSKEPLINASISAHSPAGCSRALACSHAGASLVGRAASQVKNHQISFIQNCVHAVLHLYYYKSSKLPPIIQTIGYLIPRLIYILIFIGMSSTSSISLTRRWFFLWIVVFIFITPLKVPILFIILSYEIMKGHV